MIKVKYIGNPQLHNCVLPNHSSLQQPMRMRQKAIFYCSYKHFWNSFAISCLFYLFWFNWNVLFPFHPQSKRFITGATYRSRTHSKTSRSRCCRFSSCYSRTQAKKIPQSHYIEYASTESPFPGNDQSVFWFGTDFKAIVFYNW